MKLMWSFLFDLCITHLFYLLILLLLLLHGLLVDLSLIVYQLRIKTFTEKKRSESMNCVAVEEDVS